MAGEAARVFGVMFLVVGILSAGVGVTTMMFVDAEERDRQADESGAFDFLRQDQEREEGNRAAGAGSVGAFAVGLMLAMLGLFLAALGFTQPEPSKGPAPRGKDAASDLAWDGPAEAQTAYAWAVPAVIAVGSVLMLLMFWYAVQ